MLGGDAAFAALVDAAHARGIRVIGDLTTNHSGNHHEWFRRAQADAASEEAASTSSPTTPTATSAGSTFRTLPKFDLRSPALRTALVDGRDSIVGHWLNGSVASSGGSTAGGSTSAT